MPAAVGIVAAVAGAVVSAAVKAIPVIAALGTFVSGLVAGLAGALVSFAVQAVGSAFVGQPKTSADSALSSAAPRALTGRLAMVREAASPHRMVIGQVKVSGPIIFLHTRDADGIANKYLYLAIVLASHQCEALDQIYLNDAPIDDPRFAGLVRWEFKNGTPDQTACQFFVDETDGKWTSEHRCRGRAVLFVRLTYDEAVFANGVPAITAVVRGRRVFDPRTNTVRYSANPALVVRDYLTGTHGLREDASAIDADGLIAAANLCDDAIPLKNGGTEPRWRAHGVYTLDETPAEIMRKLLTSCGGAAIYAGGIWHIEPAAWRPSNRVITADDLRGEITVAHDRPFRELFNGVRATYIRPLAEWQLTDAPVLLNPAAVTEDGGEPIYADIELPFTTSGTMAQRLMRLALRRNRAQRSVRLPVTLKHLALRPGSVVTLDLPRQRRETYRLLGWTLDEDGGGVTITAEQDGPEIYAWNAAVDERDLQPVSFINGPTGTIFITPVLTVTPPTDPVPTSMDPSWSAVSGADGYILEWRGPGGGPFTTTEQAGTSATITTNGRAEMRVRAIRGADTSAYGTAPFPTGLQQFSVAGAPDGATVEWSGAATIQVFAGDTDVFADATYRTTLTGGNSAVTLDPDTYFIWVREVSAQGVVGAELGPVQFTVNDLGSGGAATNPDFGGGEGSGGGDSEGGGMGSAGDP